MRYQIRHGVGLGDQGGGDLPLPGVPEQLVFLPENAVTTPVPIREVSGGASNRTNLWVHFLHHHVRDTNLILEEGNRTYRICP